MSAGYCVPTVLLVTLVVALGCSSEIGPDSIIEIKLGHVGAPGSLFELSSEYFAMIANEQLVGIGEVSAYGSSQLGGDDVLLQKLKLGTVELALPSTIMSSSRRISLRDQC